MTPIRPALPVLLAALLASEAGCAPPPSRVWRSPDLHGGERLRGGAHVWVLAESEDEIQLARTTLRRAGLRVHPRSRPRPELARRLGAALAHAALVHDGGTLDKIDEDFAPLRPCLEQIMARAGRARPRLEGLVVVHRRRRAWPGDQPHVRVDLAASLFDLGHGRLLALAARSYETRHDRGVARRELMATLEALARAVRSGPRRRGDAAEPAVVVAPFTRPEALPPQR